MSIKYQIPNIKFRHSPRVREISNLHAKRLARVQSLISNKFLICLLIFEICNFLFVSCASTRPVCKFGLVAPFEGRYRPLGYDAIYAARLAVRQANEAGGVGGCRVELVAYDDGGDARAAVERAKQLALDPQVVAVIGHLRVDTSRAAWDIYAHDALPLLSPVIPGDSLPSAPCDGCNFAAAFRTGPSGRNVTQSVGLDDIFAGGTLTGTLFATGAPWPRDVPGTRQFVADYRTVSNGAEPGPYAWATYQATQLLFGALRAAPVQSELRDLPARASLVRRAMGAQLALRFDAQGMLPDAPVYRYQINGQGLPVLQH